MGMRVARVLAAAGVAAMVLSFPPDAHARARMSFGATVVAIPQCDGTDRSLGVPGNAFCYEPSVAVDPNGRIFVMNAFGNDLAVSTNGGRSFVARTVPPPPLGDEVLLGDAIVQIDPRGRLVFSNIYGSGIQLAISSTAGRTWSVNTVVGLAPLSIAPSPDRQWVGFGPHGEVYVFWRTGGGIYWTATSTDGGRTFGPPEPFLPGNDIFSTGPPVVDSAGRVYVPVILLDVLYAPTIGLAVSRSGVSTTSFELHTVAPAGLADFFPIAGVDRAGRVAVAWRGDENGVRVARMSESLDRGRSWSPAHTWGPAVSLTSPWVTVRDGRIDVLSYRAAVSPESGSTLVISRGTNPARPDHKVAVASSIPGTGGRSAANTDYANFALTPDGRVVAVWCDKSVYVAVEAKSL